MTICDIKKHHDHLWQVFDWLAHFGLKNNVTIIEISEIIVSQLTFLGYVIDKNCLTPMQKKVATIQVS